MNATVTDWAMLLLGGGAAGFLVWGIWTFYQEAIGSGVERYGADEGEGLPASLRLLLPYARAFAAFADSWLSAGPGTLGGRVRLAVEARIRQAGSPGQIEAGELVGLSGVGMTLGLLSGSVLPVLLGVGRELALGLAFAGLTLGGGLPWVWILDLASERRRRILKELPYAIDLMTLSVEAGLDFTVALSKIVERLKRSPLAREFALLLSEIQMGKSRRQGLRDFKERARLMDVDFFASSLIQADEMGTGLGPVLRAQAEGIRQRRFLRAEELATKAPVKIIFPLIAFILPVTMVVILGPIAIQLWEQFRTVLTK